jgi:hypothetical protein
MPRQVIEVGGAGQILSCLFNGGRAGRFESQKNTRTAAVFIGVE